MWLGEGEGRKGNNFSREIFIGIALKTKNDNIRLSLKEINCAQLTD